MVSLCPLSWLYGLGVAARRAWLKRRPATRLGLATVSVGNLTVGGTGKTEAVALIAEWLRDRGLRPAVLSRGYGRRSREAVLVVSRGEGPVVNVQAAGDEPYLLAQRLAGVAVVVGADRAASCRMAREQLGCRSVVLDDGFQRRDQIHRDADLVLLDATDPFGGGDLLPAGRLREPVAALAEAGALLLTRCDQQDPAPLLADLRRWYPEKPVWQSRHAASGLRELATGAEAPLSALANERVLAVSGIARPGAFIKTLESLRAEVAGHFAFRDHHWFRPADCRRLLAHATALRARIVTTAKDAVRLAAVAGTSLPGWILDVRLEISPSPASWQEWLRQALEGIA
ncbi:MAG: tetraacyldisaccharide 4'-kinase [candidate division FCPU426 bacterium]